MPGRPAPAGAALGGARRRPEGEDWLVCVIVGKVLWYPRRAVLLTAIRTISSMTRTIPHTAWVVRPKFWELLQGFCEASMRRSFLRPDDRRAGTGVTRAISCGSLGGCGSWSIVVPRLMRHAASSSWKINLLRPTRSMWNCDVPSRKDQRLPKIKHGLRTVPIVLRAPRPDWANPVR